MIASLTLTLLKAIIIRAVAIACDFGGQTKTSSHTAGFFRYLLLACTADNHVHSLVHSNISTLEGELKREVQLSIMMITAFLG